MINFREIFRVARFSTFATISALFERGPMSDLSLLCDPKRTFADASGLGVHALAFDKSLTREPGRSAALRVGNQVCNTYQELPNNYLQFRLVVRRFDSVALPGGI
jgi:hypothetical protein